MEIVSASGTWKQTADFYVIDKDSLDYFVATTQHWVLLKLVHLLTDVNGDELSLRQSERKANLCSKSHPDRLEHHHPAQL